MSAYEFREGLSVKKKKKMTLRLMFRDLKKRRGGTSKADMFFADLP